MALYVDSSALLKRYVEEHDSSASVDAMSSDPVLVTSRLAEIEVRRNLTRLLDEESSLDARRQFTTDLDSFALVALDATTCNDAARIAEQTLCRSLDSIHLAAARRAGPSTALLTFDLRQAQVARSLGMKVIGA